MSFQLQPCLMLVVLASLVGFCLLTELATPAAKAMVSLAVGLILTTLLTGRRWRMRT